MNVKLSDLVKVAVSKAVKGGIKNTRDAFLYFNHRPNSPKTQFAQCVTCRMFVPDEYMGTDNDKDLCIAHGSKVGVGEEWSCGVYSPWPKGSPVPEVIRNHAAELKKGIPGSLTPKETGLVNRKVRCQNCYFFKAGPKKCNLYELLNKALPELFDLDENVDPYGCCNANIEKAKS
jgi:Pyruvate/2-oxoacid:ferredoxin oxidoreductase delta subunit